MVAVPTTGVAHLVHITLALPAVRPQAVGRARVLLDSSRWCRAHEVADELVRCYVARQVP